MSIHYLIDPTSPNADVIDVLTAESGQTDATGSTIIKVPAGVAINNQPSKLTDLLTEKYIGLLGAYSGFTQILADSCMDVSNVSLAESSRVVLGSGRVHHSIAPGGVLTFTPPTLSNSLSQCVLVWETYEYVDTNDKTGRYQRLYSEISTASTSVAIGFNGTGGSFVPAMNGAILHIPAIDQGVDLALTFSSLSGSRVHLGSWALIF